MLPMPTATRFTRLFLLQLALAFLAGSAAAQTVGATIRGIVLDQTGARLPGVEITVRER